MDIVAFAGLLVLVIASSWNPLILSYHFVPLAGMLLILTALAARQSDSEIKLGPLRQHLTPDEQRDLKRLERRSFIFPLVAVVAVGASYAASALLNAPRANQTVLLISLAYIPLLLAAYLSKEKEAAIYQRLLDQDSP